jgi:hypothetical protein
MKTYFCADGFTQGAMYDVTAELGVHVRSSSVLEDEAYHDSSTFPRAGFYLDEFLQPYTAETDNFFETYGLSNASDTLVRSAIEFYIVLRVIPNKDDPLMYRWMDMTDASLSSLDAYKGHRDSHAQGTPGFVWVPYRTSLSLTRSNYPRFSVESFAKFEREFPKYLNYLDIETNEFVSDPSRTDETIRGVGFWMRPPPYSIIAPMVFHGLDENPPLNSLYFLVHSPYLNDSMEPGSSNMEHTRFNRIPSESLPMYQLGYGHVMSTFSDAVDDSLSFFADKLGIYRLKGKWKSITLTVPMIQAAGLGKRPLKLTNKLFDEAAMAQAGIEPPEPQEVRPRRRRRRGARRSLFAEEGGLDVTPEERMRRERQETRFREAALDPIRVWTREDLDERKRLRREEELLKQQEALSAEWDRIQREREEEMQGEHEAALQMALFNPDFGGDPGEESSLFDPGSPNPFASSSIGKDSLKMGKGRGFKNLSLLSSDESAAVEVPEPLEEKHEEKDDPLALTESLSKLSLTSSSSKEKEEVSVVKEEEEEVSVEEESGSDEDAFLF